jgi:hypothetical protein
MKKIYLSIALLFAIVATQAQCLVTISGTNIQCNGMCNGSATANVVGVPPFNYLWQPGSMTTQTVTGLCPGTYTVSTVDGTSCTASNTVTITQPSPLAVTSTHTNITCNGSCNGTATSFVSGGTAGYTHKWNSIPAQTAATATALCPGVYYDTITDANGCKITSPASTITEPAALTANVACSSVTCFGGSNGSASVTQTGGTSGYTYAWNTTPVQTTATISGLTPGTYSCTVTDANNCTSMSSCTVNQPSTAVAITATSSNASCASCCDGSASSVASGGTAGYTYLWSPGGQTTSTLTAICAGNYTVCVTDANACSSCDTVSVNFTVGINEVSFFGEHIYPNPTSGDFEVVLDLPAASKVEFSIVDVLGKKVFDEEMTASGNFRKKFSMQTLPAGVYFLRTGVAGKYTTQKIIKS